MKHNRYLVSLVLTLSMFALLVCTPGSAQTTRRAAVPATVTVADKASDRLQIIVKRLQGGVYERMINLGYISSPDRYNPLEDAPTAHTEYTYLFLRFDGMEPILDSTAYVGRVFMSERYLEPHYNHKYKDQNTYKTDNDGFFMACKLFYDERSLEYRLNLYPEHVLNICRGSGKLVRPFKGMHFNKQPCTTMDQHWASLKHVLSLSDKHYDSFSDENIREDIQKFLKNKQQTINIKWDFFNQKRLSKLNPSKNKFFTKQKSVVREINLRKQIKCFTVGFIDDPDCEVATSLRSKFTKYAISEDFLEGSEYSFQYFAYNDLVDSVLADRAKPNKFLTRNPLYRTLRESAVPDDVFIPGIAVKGNLEIAYPIGIKIHGSQLCDDQKEALKIADTTEQNAQNDIYSKVDKARLAVEEAIIERNSIALNRLKATTALNRKSEKELSQAYLDLEKTKDSMMVLITSTSLLLGVSTDKMKDSLNILRIDSLRLALPSTTTTSASTFTSLTSLQTKIQKNEKDIDSLTRFIQKAKVDTSEINNRIARLEKKKQVTVNSISTRKYTVNNTNAIDTVWLYTDRYKASNNHPYEKNSIYKPKTNQFIREQYPEQDTTRKKYIKGSIITAIDKGIATKETDWCIIDIKYITDSTSTLTYNYVWLKVRKEQPATKVKKRQNRPKP